jgi:hypothetical protein
MAYYAVQSPRGFSTEPQIVHVFATEQERDSWVEDHDDAEKLSLDTDRRRLMDFEKILTAYMRFVIERDEIVAVPEYLGGVLGGASSSWFRDQIGDEGLAYLVRLYESLILGIYGAEIDSPPAKE